MRDEPELSLLGDLEEGLIAASQEVLVYKHLGCYFGHELAILPEVVLDLHTKTLARSLAKRTRLAHTSEKNVGMEGLEVIRKDRSGESKIMSE